VHESIVGGALVPPCASRGDTARHKTLAQPNASRDAATIRRAQSAL